ncbi:Cell pattern formation-associated protein STUA like [Verticillium longisporum]|nr:Cell pattern formation-associated protein STUA like [Verticillium longisporum]
MTGSPSHAPTSGRATPRTAAPPQPYYSQQPGYSTPPRVQQQPSSNLYSVMSNDRGATGGSAGSDVYAPSADIGSMSNGYAPQQPVLNGSGGIKRGREDEDDLQRPLSGGPGMEMKRRKTLIDGTIPATGYDAMARPASATVAPTRRR